VTEHETLIKALCEHAGLLARTGGLSRVRLTAGDVSVEAEWAPGGPPEGREPAEDPPEQDDAQVRAPMVGTFYRAAEPGAEPYVREGDTVVPGQQIGVVEAMKVMNPIEAAGHGRVVRVLVPDAAPVEYGQPLFLLGA
jgi:acetyl-CoA carboxylase biotin carboxyl carrier protein